MKNKTRFFGAPSAAETRQNGGRGAKPYMTFYSQEDYEREIENEIARRIGEDGGYTEDFSLFGRGEAITPSPSMTFGGTYIADGARSGYGAYPQNGYGAANENVGRGGYGIYPQNGYGVPYENVGRSGYGTYPQGNTEMTSDEIIDTWRSDAEKLSKLVPDFNLASALGNEIFKNALVSGKNVFEAYEEMITPPKNPPRAGIRQNGQSARRGTGESKMNPAKLSSADFKKYIEQIKNGTPC